eukprot:m.215830 g.215830  ORF g.215830 m.215830 type:complete len:1002 (+) comp39843_c1_seq3:1333-4338(+)
MTAGAIDVLQHKPAEGFPLFIECLRKAGYSRIASSLETDPKLTLDWIYKATPGELNDMCMLRGVNIQGKDNDAKRAKLRSLLPRAAGKQSIEIAQRAFAQYRENCQKIAAISENIKRFAVDPDVTPALERMKIREMNFWKKGIDEKNLNLRAETLPFLLVAGTTSSGKSTLINAFLGDDVLPTGDTATTPVICEIKHSKKRYAKVAFDPFTDRKSVTLALPDEKEELRRLFKKAQTKTSTKDVIHSCEIGWNSDFLKNFSIADSPGVSHTAVYLKKVIDYQRRKACGFIYVLDGSRSRREVSHAGNLVEDLAKFVKTESQLSPLSALIVVNKWDVYEQSMKTEYATKRNEKHLKKIWREIQSFWRGVKSHQVLKMEATHAFKCIQQGEVTPDLKTLCKALETSVPASLENRILAAFEPLKEMVAQTDQVLGRTFNYCHLSREEREEKHKEDEVRLAAFTTRLETSQLKTKAEEVLGLLARRLAIFLQSGDGLKEAFEQQPDVFRRLTRPSEEEFQKIFRAMLIGTIRNSQEFRGMMRRLPADLERNVNDLANEFTRVTRRHLYFSSRGIVPELPDNSFFPTAISIAAGFVSVLFGAFGIGALATEVFFRYRSGQWANDLRQLYKEESKRLCDRADDLRQLLLTILQNDSRTFGLLYESIPNAQDDARKELERNKSLRGTNLNEMTLASEKCRETQEGVSSLFLSLEMDNMTEAEITWPAPRIPVHESSLANVYKVEVENVGTAALKTFEQPLTGNDANRVFNELQFCQKIDHENILKFYGSVRVNNPSRKMGLLFEWCEKGTLQDEIHQNRDNAPATCGDVKRVQNFALQIAEGLKYLHSIGIAHRNLNPDNVLIKEDGTLKIKNLGSTKPVKTTPETLCKALLYVAPEELMNYPYSYSGDIFSLGIMMWEMWNGLAPYHEVSISTGEFINQVVAGKLRPKGFHYPSRMYDSAGFPFSSKIHIHEMSSFASRWAKLTEKFWSSYARQRPTAEEVCDNLKTM